MRFLCRAVLVCILSASLIDLPAWAAPNRTVGFILAAQNAQLDGVNAANGANVYNGDVVATGADGKVRFQFAANQVYLSPSSVASFNTDGAKVTTLLRSGTAGFTSAPGGLVAIRALDVLVRPQTAQTTTAQVTVIAPDELRVASIAGPLSVELNGESYTLTPGRTYGVKIVTETARFQDNQQTPIRNKKLIITVFVLTAAAAGIVYLYKEMTESPDSP